MNRLVEALESPKTSTAVIITEPLEEKSILDTALKAQVFELRTDKLPSGDPDYIRAQALRIGALPTILTIRLASQDGGWTGSESDRLKLFEALIDDFDGIDVEAEAEIAPEVIDLAHQAGKPIIVSDHDFVTTPYPNILEEKFVRANEMGADYVKFACATNSQVELVSLTLFTATHFGDNIITVGMYTWGPLSRIFMTAIGSKLNYVFAGDKAIAPGQLSYTENATYIERLHPHQFE